MFPAREPAGLSCVIVVAADSGPSLLECVDRVLASDAPLQLIVSDNASSDGSIAALRLRHAGESRLNIVDNGRNLGFGAGVNSAARQATGDVLLVLNPDCLIEADLVGRLRELLAANPKIGVLGVRVVDALGRVEPASRRRDPTLWRSLMSLSGLHRWQSRWPGFAGVDLPETPAATSPASVDAVSGAVMAMPRRVFDQLAGFDEAYFLHCEDLDLCRRARDAGFEVRCAEGIPVLHGKGGSSRHRPVFVSWHKHRGMWRWFRHHDPAGRNIFLIPLVWTGIWLHFGAGLPRRCWTGWKARQRRSPLNASD